MLTNGILADGLKHEKLLTALLTLLSLKCTAILAALGAFLVIALIVFSIILDALLELSLHISQVWNASTPIERLLIFLIAWAFFYKLTPTFVRICKLGKEF